MIRKIFLNKLIVGDEGGFTLLEALIGMCIFSIGILATASMQSTSINAEMSAKQNTEAASIAASIVEYLRPLSYEEDAELTSGIHDLPAQDQYNITYDIQRDDPISNTLVIQVTVSWPANGAEKSYNLTSIKPDII